MPEATGQHNPVYRGRFAPSPTGPLHAGSLMAALASWLDARAQGGEWLVRIEDLDPPREIAGAAAQILHTLERLGLCWDGEVLYQSTRSAAYDEALAALEDAGMLYYCRCSRSDLADTQGRYPGHCRDLGLGPGPGLALRCHCGDRPIRFDDRLQGSCSFRLSRLCGDFVVRRKDGLHAYQLAVVVDDAAQGITDVVRGIDLLDSTPRQIHLQQLLKLPTPRHAHVPVLVNEAGDKLSKQNLAPPADAERPTQVLFRTLQYLQQAPDPALLDGDTEDLLRWGIDHWRPAQLAGIRNVAEVSAFGPAAV